MIIKFAWLDVGEETYSVGENSVAKILLDDKKWIVKVVYEDNSSISIYPKTNEKIIGEALK